MIFFLLQKIPLSVFPSQPQWSTSWTFHLRTNVTAPLLAQLAIKCPWLDLREVYYRPWNPNKISTQKLTPARKH